MRHIMCTVRQHRRIVLFAIIGFVNTTTYYTLYLLIHLFARYLVAHVCAFVLAMISSYFLNTYFTFRTRPTVRTFLLFPLSNLANFVVTTLGLRILVGHVGMNATIAPVPVAVISIPITYLLAHYIMLGRKSGVLGGH